MCAINIFDLAGQALPVGLALYNIGYCSQAEAESEESRIVNCITLGLGNKFLLEVVHLVSSATLYALHIWQIQPSKTSLRRSRSGLDKGMTMVAPAAARLKAIRLNGQFKQEHCNVSKGLS